MRRSPAARALAVAVACFTLPPSAPAQVPTLVLPKASQRATVTQTIGLTEIGITYDRPLVNGREVWGKLVPYDSVWRAGANENTVIAFSSPVRVGGQELPAGRYGLHMIPAANEWTVILSRQTDAWGSFSYDPKEDAVRLTAIALAAPFEEALGYKSPPAASGAGAFLLAAVGAGSRLVRRQRHELGRGRRVGPAIDRHHREFHQPASQGDPAREDG